MSTRTPSGRTRRSGRARASPLPSLPRPSNDDPVAVCPLLSSHPDSEQERVHGNQAAITVYKLGSSHGHNHRWSYNHFEITCTRRSHPNTRMKFVEALDKAAVPAKDKEPPRDHFVEYDVLLANGIKISLHSFLVYENPVEVQLSDLSEDMQARYGPWCAPGSNKLYKWKAVQRSHCCATSPCTGQILQPINRFGESCKAFKKVYLARQGIDDADAVAHLRLKKPINHLYLAIDEARSHNDKGLFRVICGAMAADSGELIGLSVSPKFDVKSNNDVKDGSAYIDLPLVMKEGWSGWSAAVQPLPADHMGQAGGSATGRCQSSPNTVHNTRSKGARQASKAQAQSARGSSKRLRHRESESSDYEDDDDSYHPGQRQGARSASSRHANVTLPPSVGIRYQSEENLRDILHSQHRIGQNVAPCGSLPALGVAMPGLDDLQHLKHLQDVDAQHALQMSFDERVQQSFLETGNALAGVTDFPGNLATAGQYMFQAPLDPDMAGILLDDQCRLEAAGCLKPNEGVHPYISMPNASSSHLPALHPPNKAWPVPENRGLDALANGSSSADGADVPSQEFQVNVAQGYTGWRGIQGIVDPAMARQPFMFARQLSASRCGYDSSSDIPSCQSQGMPASRMSELQMTSSARSEMCTLEDWKGCMPMATMPYETPGMMSMQNAVGLPSAGLFPDVPELESMLAELPESVPGDEQLLLFP